jgi:hypothetical protein
MITEEEKQEIIDRAVEKALLMIPDVVGNMMSQHAVLSKINSQFYKDHPEFKDKKNIVATVIEEIDGKNPTMNYEEILKLAVPRIKDRLKTMSGLDMVSVTNRPERDLSRLLPGNGEL